VKERDWSRSEELTAAKRHQHESRSSLPSLASRQSERSLSAFDHSAQEGCRGRTGDERTAALRCRWGHPGPSAESRSFHRPRTGTVSDRA